MLGADTVVVIDGRIMGKPKDQDDAIRMLHELSGRTHQVLTGVALVYLGHEELFVSKTEVCFWPLTDKLIERYVAGVNQWIRPVPMVFRGLVPCW